MPVTVESIPGFEGQTMNVCEGEDLWRLVHDGSRVAAVFRSSGRTMTKAEIFCAETIQECLAKIEELELEVPELVQWMIDRGVQEEGGE